MSESLAQYVSRKLKAIDMTKSELADRMNVSRQTCSSWFSKNHIPDMRVKDMRRVMGEDFFKEYDLSKLAHLTDERPEVQIRERTDPALQESGSGYRIHVEIDPVNFDPEHLSLLNDSLKEALEKFKKGLEEKNVDNLGSK